MRASVYQILTLFGPVLTASPWARHFLSQFYRQERFLPIYPTGMLRGLIC